MPLRRNRARKEVQPKDSIRRAVQLRTGTRVHETTAGSEARYRSCCCGLVVVHRVWASRMACGPGCGAWWVGRWPQVWWSGGQTESRKELGN